MRAATQLANANRPFRHIIRTILKAVPALDIRGDIKAAKKMSLPWWAILSIAVSSFLSCFLFDHWRRLGLALPTEAAVMTFGFIVALKWDLRHRVWFGITVGVMIGFHVLLISTIHWTTKWVPAARTAGASSIDIYLMLTMISIVRWFVEGRSPASSR